MDILAVELKHSLLQLQRDCLARLSHCTINCIVLSPQSLQRLAGQEGLPSIGVVALMWSQ